MAADRVLLVESACEATCLWLSGNYDGCMQTLQRLEGVANGPQVAHNLAIVEYYCGGCTDSEKLLDQLASIAAGAASDGDEAAAAPMPARPGGSSSRPRAVHSGPSDGTALGPDVDKALCTLNKAIVLHQQQQSASAAAILEPLVESAGDAAVEMLSEGVALRALSLLLELQLAAGHHSKAAATLVRMEKCYSEMACKDLDGSQASAAPGLLEMPREHTSPVDSASSIAADTSASARSLWLPRVSKWWGGGVHPSVALLERQGAQPAAPDVRLLIKLYRARLHLATGNHKAAKRVLKSVADAGPAAGAGGAATAAAVLRAELEMLHGSPRKCAKLVLSLLQEVPEHELGTAVEAAGMPLRGTAGRMPPALSRAALLNNLGLAHALQGKHALAALYCSQALRADAAVPTSRLNGGTKVEKSTPLLPSQRLYAATLYNLGIQHLLGSKWQLARRCFQQAAPQYFSQPLLWLRLGEAALGLAGQHQLEEQQHTPAESTTSTMPGHPFVQAVVGSGSYRRIVFRAGNGTSGLEGPSPSSPAATKDAEAAFTKVQEVPSSSMACAREAVACLDTALHLLTLQQQTVAVTGGENNSAMAGATAGGATANGQQDAAASGGDGTAAVVTDAFAAGADPLPLMLTTVPQTLADSSATGSGAAGDAAAAAATQRQQQQQQLDTARCAALASLAYGHLLLGNHLLALSAAEALLSQPNLPARSHLLGSCYAAEALAVLGRPTEAAKLLGTCVTHQSQAAMAPSLQSAPRRTVEDDGEDGTADAQVSPGRPEDGEATNASTYGVGAAACEGQVVTDIPDATPRIGPPALPTLYVNLASLYASHGALAQAQQLAQQALALLSTLPVTCQSGRVDGRAGGTRSCAILLLVYVELAAGRTAEALALLKAQRPLL